MALTFNKFKDTTIYGTFQNSNNPKITDLANAIFDGNVTITTGLTCSGTTSFTNLPTSTATPSSSTQLITKGYADATYSGSGSGTTLAAVQANNNTWTGTNTFSTPLTLSTTSAIGSSSSSYNATAITNPLVNNGLAIGTADGLGTPTIFNLAINSWSSVGFVDTCFKQCSIYMDVRDGIIYTKSLTLPLGDVQTQISTKTTLAEVQANNNTWTGTNTFTKDLAINSMSIGLGNGSNYSNLAFGNGALGKTTGGYNLAIGGASLFQNLAGLGNTAIGYQALAANTTGSYNMGIGYCSVNSNTSGQFNIGIGTTSLVSNLTGNNNIGIGYNSGAHITSSNNACIGYNAGFAISTGTQNTAIGYQAYLTGNFSNSTAIGYSSQPTNNNQIMLGTAAESVICPNALNVTGISTLGATTFNTFLPTSTLTPSSSTQLITKGYADATYSGTNINGLNTSIEIVGFNNITLTSIGNNLILN